MDIKYLPGRNLELVIVELQWSRSDVDAEECRRIPVRDPNRRIQRQQFRRHPRPVAPRLYIETLEHNILLAPKQNAVSQIKSNPRQASQLGPLPCKKIKQSDSGMLSFLYVHTLLIFEYFN